MKCSLKGAVATVSAAALLVVGVDYATFAATGDSLILGQRNSTGSTTLLTTRGPGPALVLESAGQRNPSLAVSSSAKVRRLNADRVDGWHGKRLASRATSFRIGSPGQIVNQIGLWSLDVPPGLYQASFSFLALPDDTSGVVPGMICGLVDIDTLGPETLVYTADSTTLIEGDIGAPLAMSGSETVRVADGANVGLYCGANTATYAIFRGSASFTTISQRTVKVAPEAELPFRAVPRLAP